MELEDESESASPISSQGPESPEKEIYAYDIVSAPESSYTLEHKRQTPEEKEKKIVYSVRFEPDDGKYLAVGIILSLILQDTPMAPLVCTWSPT